MTSQEPWQRFTADNEVNIVGEFENMYGERYIIYRLSDDAMAYFTGDEVDWEPKMPLLWTSFMFNENEREQIARILWPSAREQFKAMQGTVTAGLAFASCHRCKATLIRIHKDPDEWIHYNEPLHHSRNVGCRAASFTRLGHYDNSLDGKWKASPDRDTIRDHL